MSRLLERFVAWHIRTYGMWAYRHEPWSFSIYPLLALPCPIIVWRSIGLLSGICVFVLTEALVLLMIVNGLRRRKPQKRTPTG